MAQTKLILIEGLPGSGKTTTASFVAEWLGERGREPALFLEGDLAHPADFESVARLDDDQYDRLKKQFPAEAEFLESHGLRDGEDIFFRYRHLQQTVPGLPEALVAALAQYEIYELPAATFRRLLLRRWQQFARQAGAGQKTFVFECCFLQNPLTMMLGRHDEPVVEAQAFILELAAAIGALEPVWIYLHPGEARTTLAKAARSRPQEWLDYVIAYHTQQGHGKAQGWQGFEGLVKFYEMRQAIELELLPQLPFPGLRVDHSDWVQDRARIATFLNQTFPA